MKVTDTIRNKIKAAEPARRQIQQWRQGGEQVVFTNGCFDLLHYGHIHYLGTARELGDRLVVGLNSASSVARLKGDHRPINDEQTRRHMLGALFFVDLVVGFEEDTPYQLIKTLQPDILVKGGDWKVEDIVGADLVMKNGGEVCSLPYIEGYSTSAIEQKIRSW